MSVRQIVGLVAIGLSLVLLTVLHVVGADIDPVSGTLSDYALRSYGWIFDVGTTVLAVGSVTLLGPALLRRVTVPVEAICFGCWCLGLVVLTVFPRDPVGVPVSLVGEIHRFAAVATLVGLPLGALLTAARRPRHMLRVPARAVTVGALVCLAALVPFVISYLTGSPLKPYVGLIERLVSVGEIGLLLLVGLRLHRFAPARSPEQGRPG
ncbi:DUF998 domain-containing protein [Micromonospora zhanjiangensis]|uniref:DUF998 domain-containing protein n=1 Tax=Micromonospora zhanjiangensis TaxID=1522057 RepID=A0ABV8KLF8_9ACTN